MSKKPNLDEECETLLEDNGCKYFRNAQKLFGLQASSSLQAHSPSSGSYMMPCQHTWDGVAILIVKGASVTRGRHGRNACFTVMVALDTVLYYQSMLLIEPIREVCLQVHDIEDLVKIGHSMQACPYFAARHYKGTLRLLVATWTGSSFGNQGPLLTLYRQHGPLMWALSRAAQQPLF